MLRSGRCIPLLVASVWRVKAARSDWQPSISLWLASLGSRAWSRWATRPTFRVTTHTAALLAASDVTVDALFRQAGVIRTDTLDEMLDVAELLAHQPRPAGGRVAILTNAGGPAVMCADACEAR